MRRKPWFVAIASLALCFGASSRVQAGNLQLPAKQPVEIPTMDFPKFGLEIRNAVDLAVAQFGGQLFHHPIITTHLGHGCNSPNDKNNLIEGIIHDPKVLGLVGPICSGVAGRIVPPLNDAGVPVISPANTAAFLTDPATHLPFYFRTAPSDAFQGKVGADFARQGLNATSASILHYDPPDDYSVLLSQTFQENFTDQGGTIANEFTVDFGQSDFSQILDAIGAVDVVYAPIFFGEALPFFQQLRERDPNGNTAILSTDGSMSDGLFPILGDDPVNLYFSNVVQQGPNYDSFASAYRQKYDHDPEAFEALAFDATLLLLRAAAAVGHEDSKGKLTIVQQDLLQSMNDPRNYPYVGAGGTYQAPVNGDLNPDGEGIFQAEGGAFLPVFP